MKSTESGERNSVAIRVILAVAVMLIVAAIVVFAAMSRSKPLPTGEAAGVDIPPAKIPTSPTPINPYKERAKPAPVKPDQAPSTGGQSWGP